MKISHLHTGHESIKKLAMHIHASTLNSHIKVYGWDE